jgi:hypothetical protein
VNSDQVGIQNQGNRVQGLRRVKQDTKGYEIPGIIPEYQKNLLETGTMTPSIYQILRKRN